MNRISIIEYKNIQIVFTDLSFLSPDECSRIVKMTTSYFARFPEKSVYSLVNMTGLSPQIKIIESIKEAAQKNAIYVKSTAVYGLSGFRMLVANSVAALARRETKFLSGKDACLQWLYNKSKQQSDSVASRTFTPLR